MLKRASFRGHIDRISDGYLFGWLFDARKPNRSVVFELFVDGAYRGQWICAYFRPDLLKGGLGNGVHGFKVPIAGPTSIISDSIEIFVPSPSATWLASRDGQLREQKGVGATRTTRLRRFWDRLGQSEAVAAPNCKVQEWAVTALSQSNVYRADRKAHIQSCDFTEFLRRLNHRRESDRQFYSWYVNEYIYNLDPQRIPLSEGEKLFIKSLVESAHPECRSLPLSICLRVFLWKNFYSLQEMYNTYWWSVEGGRQIKLGHLIPLPVEASRLRDFVRYGFGKSFPLTYFMFFFAVRNRWLSPFLMLFPAGRRRIYRRCFLYASRNAHFRRYVDEEAGLKLTRGFHPERGNRSQRQDASFSLGEGVREAPSGSLPGNASFAKRCSVDRATYRLQFIGPIDKLLGLGESSRRLMNAVRMIEPDCNFVCYNDGIQSASIDGDYKYEISRSCINIIHLNMEQIPEFFLRNAGYLRESYNIIFPYWELSKLSSLHFLGISMVDEVWTASTFVSSLFQSQNIPAITIGLPTSVFSEPSSARFKRVDSFEFLATFDAFSWPQRKNAIAVVDAFIAAFEGNRDVRLTIKTQNADNVHSIHQKLAWEALRERCNGDSRITVINETYAPSRQRELIQGCDCLVSLHRAEGLGVDILDALASGIPVVATAYSGNMDVCTPHNSWLVDFDLVEVEEDEYVFVEPGHLWANPKSESAVRVLRDVFWNRREREVKCKVGIADADRLRSVVAVAERIRQRLFQLRKAVSTDETDCHRVGGD